MRAVVPVLKSSSLAEQSFRNGCHGSRCPSNSYAKVPEVVVDLGIIGCLSVLRMQYPRGGSSGRSGASVTTNGAITANRLYATNSLTSTVDEYTADQSGDISTITTLSTSSVPEAITGDTSAIYTLA